MKNTLFGCSLFFALMNSNGFLNASQNDFLGKWVGNIDITGIGIFEVNINISESNITMEFEFMVLGQKNSAKETVEIISWSEVVNNSSISGNDYPNGFNLETRTRDGNISILAIYISEDKKRLIVSALLSSLPSLNEDNIRSMTFEKK